MDLKEINLRIEKIKRVLHERSDNERAHLYEDQLYVDVLGAIADGECENPAEYAREALKADDINFARWYS